MKTNTEITARTLVKLKRLQRQLDKLISQSRIQGSFGDRTYVAMFNASSRLSKAIENVTTSDLPWSLARDELNARLPDGWRAHPQAPGYYYKGQEIITEADLRARHEGAASPTWAN